MPYIDISNFALGSGEVWDHDSSVWELHSENFGDEMVNIVLNPLMFVTTLVPDSVTLTELPQMNFIGENWGGLDIYKWEQNDFKTWENWD